MLTSRFVLVVVLAPVLLAACPKPEPTVGGDAAAPQVVTNAADAASPTLVDAAMPAVTAAASSPKPADPTALKVTGKLRYQPSWSYMPGMHFDVKPGEAPFGAKPATKK